MSTLELEHIKHSSSSSNNLSVHSDGSLTVPNLNDLPSLNVTGDLTVDTNTLKVDSTNNRVGVGTTTGGHSARLKIGGTDSGGYAAAIQLENDNAGGNGGWMLTTDNNWTIQTSAGQGGLALGIGGAQTNNTSMFVGADGLVVIGGHNEDLNTWISNSSSSGTGIHLMDAVSVGRGGDASNHASEYGYEAGRRVIGWWHGQANSASGNYLHLRTSLWGGGSPHGQSEYIMGGFQIKGHRYSSGSSVSDQTIYFHNWSASTNNGYSMSNNGASWNPNNAVYVDSTGYCTIRLECGSYNCYFIDCHQIGLFYPVRDIRVTNEIYSANTTI